MKLFIYSSGEQHHDKVAAISRATMNQIMSNLVCEGFHHVLLKYGHEMLKHKKENLMTSHFKVKATIP